MDATADKFTAANLSLLKRVAMGANPRIRPYKTRSGYEYYVAFAGLNVFRDLKIDLQVVNKDARSREGREINGAPDNPLFQDGDQIYDGVIVRLVPEISAVRDQRLDLAQDCRQRHARASSRCSCAASKRRRLPTGRWPSPPSARKTTMALSPALESRRPTASAKSSRSIPRPARSWCNGVSQPGSSTRHPINQRLTEIE